MVSSPTHGSSPSGLSALVAKPIVAALLIALPLLLAGVYALISDRDLAVPAAQSESTAQTPSDGSAGADAGADADAADPLAKTRSALSQTQLPLTLLTSGITQLTDAAPQLGGGVVQLSDGLGIARTGTDQLADGAGQLSDGLVQLNDGVGQLGDGAVQISDGVNTVTTPLLDIGAQQATVTASIADVANKVQSIGGQIAVDAATQLRGLIDTLNTQGIGPDTVSQLNQLREGAALLAFQLDDPTSEFVNGMSTAASASGQLADGAGQLRDGIVQLDDGGKQLRTGTDQLVGAVPQITGVVGNVDTNVKAASAALPARDATTATTTTDESGQTVVTMTVSAGGTSSNYLLAALLAVGAVAGVSLLRLVRRGTHVNVIAPIVAVVTLAAAASIAFVYLGDSPSFGIAAGAVGFLLLSAAAFLAAAGAIQVLFGRAVGQSVNLVLLLVQMVLCGAAFVGNPDRAFFSNVAAFTPLGWVTAGLERIASGSPGSTGWLAIVVMVAILGLSGLVFALVNRSERVDGDVTGQVAPQGGHGFA